MLQPDGRTRDTGRHPGLGVPGPVPHRVAPDVDALIRDSNAGPPEHGPGERAFATLDDAASTLGLDAGREQVARRAMAHAAAGKDLMEVALGMRKAGIDGAVVQEAIRRGLDLGRRGVDVPPELLAKAVAPAGPKAAKKGPAVSPGLPRGAAPGTVHPWKGGQFQKQADGTWKPIAEGASAAPGAAAPPPPVGKVAATPPGKGAPAPKPAPGGPPAAAPPPAPAAGAAGPAAPGQPGPGGLPPKPMPDPGVQQRFRQIAAHAKAHGVDVSGSVKPGHTHDHLDNLEGRVNAHLAAKHGLAGGAGPAPALPPTRPGAMGAPVPPAAPPPGTGLPGAADAGAPPPPPGGGMPAVPGQTPPQAPAPAPGAAPGAPGAVPVAPPPGQPANPDGSAPVPGAPGADTPPAPKPGAKMGPHEVHALQQRIADLENQLEQAKQKMTAPYHKQVYNELKADAAAVRKRPSAEAEQWFTTRVRGFLAFLTGAAVGVATAGVLGPAAGIAAGGFVANHMLKSDDAGPRLFIGAGGVPVLADPDELAKSAPQPPPGYEAIPGGRHGGYRKRMGAGYDYWYPSQAAAGDAARHHATEGRIAMMTNNTRAQAGTSNGPSLDAEGHYAAAEGAASYVHVNRDTTDHAGEAARHRKAAEAAHLSAQYDDDYTRKREAAARGTKHDAAAKYHDEAGKNGGYKPPSAAGVVESLKGEWGPGAGLNRTARRGSLGVTELDLPRPSGKGSTGNVVHVTIADGLGGSYSRVQMGDEGKLNLMQAKSKLEKEGHVVNLSDTGDRLLVYPQGHPNGNKPAAPTALPGGHKAGDTVFGRGGKGRGEIVGGDGSSLSVKWHDGKTERVNPDHLEAADQGAKDLKHGAAVSTVAQLHGLPPGTVLRAKGDRRGEVKLARKRANGNWDTSTEKEAKPGAVKTFATGGSRGTDENKYAGGVLGTGADWKVFDHAADDNKPALTVHQGGATEPVKPHPAFGDEKATAQAISDHKAAQSWHAQAASAAGAMSPTATKHEQAAALHRDAATAAAGKGDPQLDHVVAGNARDAWMHSGALGHPAAREKFMAGVDRTSKLEGEHQAKAAAHAAPILDATYAKEGGNVRIPPPGKGGESDRTMHALVKLATGDADGKVGGWTVKREKDGGYRLTREAAAAPAAAPAAKAPAAPPPPPPKASKPAAPGVPAPPPPKGAPKAGASHDTNEHGHRDGLKPGQTLKLRERHGGQGDGTVKVLAGGKFEHDGRVYDGGHALMSAIHGTPQHQTTVRRYFKLGGEVAREAVEKAHSDLVTLLKGAGVLASRDDNEGTVTLTGDLRKAGVPEFMLPAPNARRAVLDIDGAEALATHLRSSRA